MNSRKTFRMAGAMPPRSEQIFPSTPWLQEVAQAGYSHLILQNDPFFHTESNPLFWGENYWRHLNLFDMVSGPRHRSYQAWLREVSRSSAEQGLEMGLLMWEPRLSEAAKAQVPQQWWGRLTPADDFLGSAATLKGSVLCLSHPEARTWFLEGFAQLFEVAPSLTHLILGVNDNGALLCDDSCPRCRGQSLSTRIAQLYCDVQKACQKKTPRAQVVCYDWFWSRETYDEVFRLLPKELTPVLTRLEKGTDVTPLKDHPEWTGSIFDMSLASAQPGSFFRRVQSEGGPLLVMLTLSGMFEAFYHSYVPAIGQVLDKFASFRQEKVLGWIDYDCGGIQSGLMLDLVKVVQHHPEATVTNWSEKLSLQRYGSASSAQLARQAWLCFDEAVTLLPMNLHIETVKEFSGRFGVALGLTPIMPFLKDRALAAKDSGDHYFWFDPHNFLVVEAIKPVIACYQAALVPAQKALKLYQTLARTIAAEYRRAAESDLARAELAVLLWQSNLNFYLWADSWQRNDDTARRRVVIDEIRVTERYLELMKKGELEIGNMTWSMERMLTKIVPEASGDLQNLLPQVLPEAEKTLVPSKYAGQFAQWKLLLLLQESR